MKQLALLLIFLISSPVWAQSSMVFKREILTILPKEEPVIQTGNEEEAQSPTPQREAIRFYTEIRPEQVLQMNWVMALGRVDAQSTLTVMFEPPLYDVIYPQPVQQPLDVLLVSPEGVITHIMPELVLAQLTQPIESERVIRARVILKGGAAEALGIIPGDRVEHEAFHPAPKVLK